MKFVLGLELVLRNQMSPCIGKSLVAANQVFLDVPHGGGVAGHRIAQRQYEFASGKPAIQLRIEMRNRPIDECIIVLFKRDKRGR